MQRLKILNNIFFFESENTLHASIHPLSLWNSYEVNMPCAKDRTLFFNLLIEAAMSILLEGINKKSQDTGYLPELPKAPKLASGPKVSELKAKVEAEQHALRRLRMCLRDICNRYVNLYFMYSCWFRMIH